MTRYRIMITSGGVTDVGKTTLAKHIAAYLREQGRDVEHIGVEMAHKELDGENRRCGVEYEDVVKINTLLLSSPHDIIIDVGGENSGPLTEKMRAMGDGALRRLTHYVVPITETVKEENIVNTIESLVDRGAPAERIYLVFNRVAPSMQRKIARQFPGLAEMVADTGVNLVSTAILCSELIEKNRGKQSVFDVDCDITTLERLERESEEAINAGNLEKAAFLSLKTIDVDMARMATSNMRKAFDEIFSA